jgi:hypothetical protein
MRVFWMSVLLTGMVLLGVSVYDSNLTTTETGVSTVSASEDGTGFPNPH